MSAERLLEVVTRLGSTEEELTIYAALPWTCESIALLSKEPDEGGLPMEVRELGLAYFLEVAIANEFLQGWQAGPNRNATDRERCDRLIEYATNDA